MAEILNRYQWDTVKANSWEISEMTILNSKSHDETWSFGDDDDDDDVPCHIGLSGNRRINLEMRIYILYILENAANRPTKLGLLFEVEISEFL